MIFVISAENAIIFMFIFTELALLLVTIFSVNFGDKMQLVPKKKIPYMILVTFIVATLYETLMFFFDPDFVEQLNFHMIISMGVAIITSIVVKIFVYNDIRYQEIQDLTVLEKGQDLLEVIDLKVYYPLFAGMIKKMIGSVRAVDGVSFNIKTGETLGLVGESGCGKTTIAKHILGLVPRNGGSVSFRGNIIPLEYTSRLRQKIQIVFQDPDASLNPRLKVFDAIAEPLRNLLGITNKIKLRTHVLKLMEQVSLKREHMDRYPHEFSGGQKQRIVIARALACNPELIILDEPTSALDVSVQAQILNILKDLQDEFGYGFLFITHNLSVVNHIADKVAVMYLGKIVEFGNVEQIFSNPSHPYSVALLNSRSKIDPKNQEITFAIKGEIPSPISPPSGCFFNPRCSSSSRIAMCAINYPEKREIEPGHFIWCHRTDI
jgi:oligopeptide/dipeptide ABC transporter ATP-binding protein